MIDAGGLTTSTTAKTAENKDVIPDAVPRTQGDGAETAGSMTSTIIAILAIIVITVCLGLAAAYYRRRQRQKRPDADAAVVYDAESRLNRDTANMVRTRGSVNLGTEDTDNSPAAVNGSSSNNTSNGNIEADADNNTTDTMEVEAETVANRDNSIMSNPAKFECLIRLGRVILEMVS